MRSFVMPLLRGTQLRGISTTSTLQELVQAPKVTRPSPQVFRPTRAKEDARLKLNRVITTVDPARLSESDFLDLAGIFNCTIHVHSPPFTSGAFQARFRAGPQEEEVRLEKPSRYLWPESAKGFLYYCVPEARHPATGQVRFRCIKRHGSTAFQKGKDLLLSSGLPWSLPVANIIKHKSYQPLLDLLVHENHVSSELVASYTNLQLFPSRGRPVIYALKQPFVWKGTSKRLYLWIAHGDSIQPASFTLTPKFFDKLPPGPKLMWLEPSDREHLIVRLLQRKPSSDPTATPKFLPTQYWQPIRTRKDVESTAALKVLLPE